MEMAKGSAMDEKAHNFRKRRSLLFGNMKRFKQGLLSEIWSYLYSHFLAGSHFLPIDVLPPGLTSSRGAVTWKTGEC